MRVSELSQLLDAVLEGDGSREVQGVAALDTAGPEDVAFAEGERGLARALESHAGCILVVRGASVPGHTTLGVDNPKLALVRAAEVLLPPELRNCALELNKAGVRTFSVNCGAETARSRPGAVARALSGKTGVL